MWKQYRQLRSFWISMAGLAVFLQLLTLASVALSGSPRDLDVLRQFGLIQIGWILAAFYALGAGATAFATEHETNTYPFQQALPVSARRLFWSNVAFAAASAVLLFLVLGLWSFALGGFRIPRPDAIFGGCVIWGTAAAELLVWGVFFSLVLRQPLTAAIVAAAVASITSYVITVTNLQPWSMDVYASRYYWHLPCHLTLIALVGAVDVWLGSRWFRESVLPWRGWADRGDQPAMDRAASGTGITGPSRLGVLWRLIWQEVRQSRGLIAVTAALVAPLVLFLAVDVGLRWTTGNRHLSRTWQTWANLFTVSFYLAGAAAPLAGAFVFLSDRRHHSYRFLAERGISPRPVWLSRHLVWLTVTGACLLAVLVMLVGVFLAHVSMEQGSLLSFVSSLRAEEIRLILLIPVLVIGAVLLGYCAGQLCSMFLRSGLLAGVFSLVLTGLMMAWAALMWAMDVPWLWSVLTIPLVFLLATWLRAPHWILEQGGIRGWRAPMGVLAGFAVALLAGAAVYRVCQIPRVDPGFSLAEFTRPRTAEEQETVAMYQRAMDLYMHRERPNEVRVDKETGRPIPEPKDQELARTDAWIKANQKTIELALEATRRPRCDVPIDHDLWLFHPLTLGELLLRSAERLRDTGKLDESLEHYRAVLRLSRHIRPRSPWQDMHDHLERDVYQDLPLWAARPGQTPELIRRAIQGVVEATANLPSRSDAIKAEYALMRRVILGDEEALSQKQNSRRDLRSKDVAPVLITRWVPWERARALRMLDFITAERLKRYADYESAVREGRPIPLLPERWSRRELWPRPLSAPILTLLYYDQFGLEVHALLDMESRRRAVRLQLALIGWHLEHGKLPDTLDPLVGPFLAEMPLDPYAGEPFRYFPRGLPMAITYRGDLYTDDTPMAKANQPFVWSTGPGVDADRPVAVDLAEKDLLKKYRIREYDGHGKMQLHTPSSEYEIWQHGLIFPVPIKEEKPQSRGDAE